MIKSESNTKRARTKTKIHRKTDYLLDKYNIHDNQKKAGEEIIDNYNYNIRYCILVAQMQSGKTGTAKYLVYYLSKIKKEIEMNDIYFICGMNDNDLRSQAVKEFKSLIPEKNILFSKQLQKLSCENYSSIVISSTALLIIDESHYGSNRGSQIDKFLKYINGTNSNFNYTLSISATPMSEIATKDNYGKALVYLRPDVAYYGIKDIFRDGNIYQSSNLSKDDFNDFLDIIEKEYERQKKSNWKYGIIRLPCQWYKEFTESCINSLDYECCYIDHHSNNPDKEINFNDYLSDKPQKFTIIWVYNSLRAGKQLNTANIGFTHDTNNSNCDIIAQSLLGRCFGYNKEKHNVHCYTDMVSAKEMLDWVQNWYSELLIPSGCKNVKNGKTNKVKKWNLHPPLLITLPNYLTQYYRELKIKHNNRYPYKEDLFDDIVRNSGENEELVRKIIASQTYHPGKCGGLMILTEANSFNSFKSFWSSNYKAYLSGKPVRGFDANNNGHNKLFYVFYNLNPNSDEYSKLLITYKEKLDSIREATYVTASNKSMYYQPRQASSERFRFE